MKDFSGFFKHHLGIIVIILVSSLGSFYGIKSLSAKNNWLKNDKEELVKKCLKDANKMAVKYPDLTKDYCDCSSSKIQQNFNRKEYLQISKQNLDYQTRIIVPVIQDCLENYKEKIQKRKRASGTETPD